MEKIISIIILLFLLISCSNELNENTNIEEIAEEIIQPEPPKYVELRTNMVETQLKTRDVYDENVLAAMGKVQRHKFVPSNLMDNAYQDNPLPIGYGQTISQPYIVALMTQELKLDKDDRVLEIGTGSGYQAAILAELVEEVYTIEIVDELAESAKQTLAYLGYDNIDIKNADGYFGWQEKAPFDAIIITAAANHLPPPLIDQLKDNGRLIIPLGSTLRFQTLTLVTKKGNELETEFISGVRFVPMTGKAQK